MLEFLVSWAEQLIIALIIIIMVELIIPNSNYRKYIKVILGIFIIYTMFNPLISGKLKKVDFGEVFSYEESTNYIENQNQIDYNKQIQQVYKEKFKETLCEDLKQKGYEAKEIETDLEYNEEKINIKKLQFKISKFTQTENITIEKVEIKQEKSVSQEEIEQIKEEISSTYDIQISKIFIESEN